MKRFAGWPTYVALIVVVIVFAASLAWGLVRLAKQDEVIYASETTGGWLAVQGEHELMHFLATLARFGGGDPDVSRDDLTRSLDIFWSRLPLLLSGRESAELRRAWPEAAERVQAVLATLEAIEPRIQALEHGDRAAYKAIEREIAWFHDFFSDLTREVLLKVQVDHVRSRIHEASLRLIAPFAGILVSGSLLITLLVHHMNAARRESEERRRAEAAHRRGEASLANAQRIARLGSWERDFKTGKVTWSDEHYRLFGYAPGAFAMTFEAFLKHVHPEDRDALERIAQRTIEAGDSGTFEYRIIREDGSVRHLASLSEVVRDENGNPVKLAGTAQDITERKLSERQDALLGVFLDNVGDAVEITDAEGRIEYVNPAHERITGYAAAEAVGRTPAQLHRPPAYDPKIYEQAWEVIASGRVWKGRLEGRKKDGSRWFQDATVSPVLNGKGEITHYIALKRDVTEYIRAEEALRESEQRFRDIVEASSDWIWEMDENLRFTSFSDRVKSVSGHYPQHLVGKTRWEGAGADPDNPKWRAHRADLEARRSFRDFRYEYTTLTGERVHLVASGKPVFDGSGVFKGYRGTSNNVTERVRAEESLRRQALILDQMSDGVIVTALDGTIVDVNKASERMFGYSRQELIGELPDILHAPSHSALQRAAIIEALTTRDGWSGELRIRRKDGSQGVCETAVLPFRNERGEVVANVGVNRDITERKRAEEELRASEERFRGAFANSTVAMGLVDLDGRFLQVNRSFCEMLGYSEAELLAMGPLDVTHPDDRGAAHRIEQRLIAGEAEMGRLEKRYVHKNGGIVWSDLGLSLVRDAARHPLYFIGIVVDTTERKAAEDALRRQALVLEQMSDGLIVTGLDGLIIDWNEAAERMYGYAKGEVLGRSPALLDVAGADGKQWPIDEALQRKGHWSGERRFGRKDGSEGVNEVIIKPFRNEKGEVVAYIGVNRDITERKRAEEELRESEERFRGAFANSTVGMGLVDLDGRFLQVNRSLCDMLGYDEAELLGMNRLDITHPDDYAQTRLLFEHMLAGAIETVRLEKRYLRKDGRVIWGDMGISLVHGADGRPRYAIGQIVDVTERKRAGEALLRAKDEAELANRVKTEFLANMSHELRTPLNSIIGFSDVLRSESYGPIGAAKYREYADDIHTAGRHLLELINDILELARVDIAELALDEEDVDVAKTLDACSRMIGDRAWRAGVSVALAAAGDLPYLHADKTRFRQIVLNLLSNAVKFTGAGGQVTLSAAVDDLGAMVIEVADTGIGIAAADIPKVLTRFGRVEGTETRKYEGSGLGLTMVQSLAALHGATFALDSELGKGTRARVRFPPERTVPAAAAERVLSATVTVTAEPRLAKGAREIV